MATPRGRLLLAAHEAANALSETDLVEIAKSEAGDKPSLKARALGWLGRKESPKELVQRVLEQQGEFADMDAGAVLEQLRHSRRVLDAVALSVDPSTLRRTNARLLREHAAGVQQEYSERVLSHLPEGVLDIIGLSLGRDDQSSLLTQALPVRAAHVFPAWTSADGRIKAGQAK